VITDTGINRSGHAVRCARQDEQAKQAILTREQKRKAIADSEEFAEILSKICPEYFGNNRIVI